MKFKFIKSNEKKKILAQLNKQFGITDLPYLLIETGKEKFRAFSGNLTKDEIMDLWNITNIETIGTYIFKKEKNNQFRLSLDGTTILGDQIKKNIVEINEDQFNKWIRGFDLKIKAPNGMVAMRYEQDFIGNGISTGEKIVNHVPKERRIRN